MNNHSYHPISVLYTNPIPGLDLDMINFYDFKIHYGGAQCTVFWDAEVNDERRQVLYLWNVDCEVSNMFPTCSGASFCMSVVCAPMMPS